MSGARLAGRVAVVTGGSSGLGRAGVLRFAAEGARVAIGALQPEAGAELAARIGAVSERFHTPQVAIAICAVLAEVWLSLFAFTSLLGPISGFIGFTLSFLMVSLTAIIFPFVKREVFENSPVAWRVAGIPVISVFGVVSIVFIGVGTARILVDHAYTPNLAFADVGALIVIAAGALIFYAMRFFRRRQGMDIDQRYREIPIE